MRSLIPEGHLARGGHEGLRLLGEVAVTLGRRHLYSKREAPPLGHIGLERSDLEPCRGLLSFPLVRRSQVPHHVHLKNVTENARPLLSLTPRPNRCISVCRTQRITVFQSIFLNSTRRTVGTYRSVGVVGEGDCFLPASPSKAKVHAESIQTDPVQHRVWRGIQNPG